jgi:hypothetical protein
LRKFQALEIIGEKPTSQPDDRRLERPIDLSALPFYLSALPFYLRPQRPAPALPFYLSALPFYLSALPLRPQRFNR